jgi:hypothetical protein
MPIDPVAEENLQLLSVHSIGSSVYFILLFIYLLIITNSQAHPIGYAISFYDAHFIEGLR